MTRVVVLIFVSLWLAKHLKNHMTPLVPKCACGSLFSLAIVQKGCLEVEVVWDRIPTNCLPHVIEWHTLEKGCSILFLEMEQ